MKVSENHESKKFHSAQDNCKCKQKQERCCFGCQMAFREDETPYDTHRGELLCVDCAGLRY